MSNKQVVVPQHGLDELEEARVRLYEILKDELTDKISENLNLSYWTNVGTSKYEMVRGC